MCGDVRERAGESCLGAARVDIVYHVIVELIPQTVFACSTSMPSVPPPLSTSPTQCYALTDAWRIVIHMVAGVSWV
jgi:hypothetical protein